MASFKSPILDIPRATWIAVNKFAVRGFALGPIGTIVERDKLRLRGGADSLL
jgi:hypothetical protein